ncbi:hypothetical protein AAJ76_2400027265 [Vairimorpha ceranae]|uniref:Uncharacterized protein n=1 Tax=Vairimorpha ceranae TaxID=40302 RepID=A0A0F9WQY2_9MICR|nr:hypothetical protein AAJ76_2400027265 [Vairimorpha ceranae]KKO75328.1 hypothetical protein AAJ76_2400027265 [Vairimorpha ceranae]
MLVCVNGNLILSFGAVEAFLDDNKLILFYIKYLIVLFNHILQLFSYYFAI